MPRRLRAVSIEYVLDFPAQITTAPTGLPKHEQHRQKAVAALCHLQALGRLMQLVEIAHTKGVAAGFNEQRLLTLADANQGVGEMIEMLCDGAITEIDLMMDEVIKLGIKTMAGELAKFERKRAK